MEKKTILAGIAGAAIVLIIGFLAFNSILGNNEIFVPEKPSFNINEVSCPSSITGIVNVHNGTGLSSC